MRYANLQEARTAFQTDVAKFEAAGAIFRDVQAYIPEAFKRDFALAMDAQPTLTTTANNDIPAMLTTLITTTHVRLPTNWALSWSRPPP